MFLLKSGIVTFLAFCLCVCGVRAGVPTRPLDILDVRDAPVRAVFHLMLGNNVSFTDEIQGTASFRLEGRAIEGLTPEEERDREMRGLGDYPPIRGWLQNVQASLGGSLVLGFEREAGYFYVSLAPASTRGSSHILPNAASERLPRGCARRLAGIRRNDRMYSGILVTEGTAWSEADVRVIHVGDTVPGDGPDAPQWRVLNITLTEAILRGENNRRIRVSLKRENKSQARS